MHSTIKVINLVFPDTVEGGEEFTTTYTDVVMHQVSREMIQMVFSSGDTLILTEFYKIEIIPDDEARENFLAQTNPTESKAANEEKAPAKEKITSIK